VPSLFQRLTPVVSPKPAKISPSPCTASDTIVADVCIGWKALSRDPSALKRRIFDTGNPCWSVNMLKQAMTRPSAPDARATTWLVGVRGTKSRSREPGETD